MRRRHFLQLFTAFVCGVPLHVRADEKKKPTTLAIVVHPDGPAKELSSADAEAIFSARKRFWDSGERILPFNLPPNHDLRVLFDRAVLHMSPDEVAKYWIDERVRGGNRPPKQVPSPALMLAVVAKLQGAIGYVPLSSVHRDVRVIAVGKDGKVMGAPSKGK